MNNLRDIPTDATTGKRTLAVVLGPARTRALYAGCVLGAFAFVGAVAALRPAALVALVALVARRAGADGAEAGRRDATSSRCSGMTGGLGIAFSVLLAFGIAL